MGSAEQLGTGPLGAGAGRRAPSAAAVALIVLSGLCRCVLLTGVALASWTVVPGLVGLQATTVMSGSMTPGFQVGDAVITRPIARADLAAGQVLLFDDPDRPGELRLHRLVRARGDRLVTKGDANPSPDSTPAAFTAVHGVGFVRVPGAGLPAYWVRTGQPVPLVVGAVGAIVLALGSRLDRRLVGPRHVDHERAGPRGRTPRHRWRAAVPVAVVVGAACAVGLPVVSPARASFSAQTSIGPSTFTACVDYPVRGALPASAVAYLNYMEASGTATVNRASPAATVSMFGAAGHGPGTCSPDASPYLTVGGSGAAGVVAGTASNVPSAGTIATWFRTGVPSGTIADIGSSGSSQGSAASNLVLYMSSTGSVVFGEVTSQALGVPLGGTTCQSPPGLADGSWHLVIATFSSTAGCTIGVDGTAPATGTAAVNTTAVNLQLLSGFAGYWRLGYDVLPAFWPGTGSTPYFQGDLDESQIYTSVLTPAQQATIIARRR